MTNEELVARIRAGIDKADNMLILYNQNRGMIYIIAKKYTGYAELEDLTQEGYIGLCNAVENYDPDGGTPFVSYAWTCIKRQIQRYVYADKGFPEHRQRLLIQYKIFESDFVLQCGRKPQSREIRRYMGIDEKQLAQLKKDLYMEQTASIDSPLGEDDLTLADTLASGEDVESSVLDKVQQAQLRTVLWEAVDRLPWNQPEVLRKHYRENMTLEQIGHDMGVSRERARVVEGNALQSLRRNSRLRSFVEIRSRGMKGTGVGAFNHTWTSATERVALELLEIGVDVRGLSVR